MNTFKKIITLSLVCVAHSTFAGNLPMDPDQLKSIKLGPGGETVSVYVDDGIVTQTSQPNKTVRANPADCSKTYPVQLTHIEGKGVTEPGYDQMFSTLLAAKISGAEVRLWLSDTRCSRGGYPSVTYIELR